ncbi:MAG: MgtC/SapB family protein [Porphyromonadaceae bacterium]|nr:MAG: MgtC/SapB family protein [Porphyromonadaceae bacterium]
MEIKEFIIRLLVAMAAGALIGLERQIHHKSAGIRTNALVSMGSSIFVLISLQITQEKGGDATRIIGQIVTGIGFLGAGVILHQGINVQGLTTAATIWCSSGIGCLSAAGYFAEAAISTVAVIFINFFLRWIDDLIKKPDDHDQQA